MIPIHQFIPSDFPKAAPRTTPAVAPAIGAASSNDLAEYDRHHDASGREEPREPGPIQFTRTELVELEAILLPERSFVAGLIEDAEPFPPAHLVERRDLLNGLLAKVALDPEDE